MGKKGNQIAIDALIDLLRPKPYPRYLRADYVQVRAVEALGEIGDPKAATC